MKANPASTAFELIYVIVNDGMGSKVMQKARKCGIAGGTICRGKGTVSNRILEFLGLNEARKEIVLMVADKIRAEQAIKQLASQFSFARPNHGIVFTTSVSKVIGTRSCKTDCKADSPNEERGVNPMYHLIQVVVDKGKAEEVIDAATAAGSTGGTIINGRGSGIHETSKLFAMDIEPEKEIVLIIAEEEKSEAITNSIRKELQIEEPGNGIIFVQEVNQVYGLRE